MVSSEFAPLASTGDLGDAVGALARGLALRGHEVAAVVPDYGPPAPVDALSAVLLGEVPTTRGPRRLSVRVEPGTVDGLFVARLECPPLYDRPGFYGSPDDYEDNPDRFWTLAAGAMAVVRQWGWMPDIAHGHDWHAGWLPALLRSQPDLQNVRTVHTGYDLRMPGSAPIDWARRLGVVPELLNADGIEYFGQVSFAKIGLRFADAVVMSSPQACDPPEGLAGVVRARGPAVTRIPRAVDAQKHDPAQDIGIPARYSEGSMHGKQTCKRRLQAAMGLEVNPHALVVLLAQEPTRPLTAHALDPQVQWLVVEGLPDGLCRLAFAGADAVLEPSGDPWSALCLVAERYGLACIIPGGPDVSKDAFVYDPQRPPSLDEALNQLVAHFSDAQRWQADLRERLARDPQRAIARYEAVYRHLLAGEAGPVVGWATPSLTGRLRELGA